MMMGHLCLLIDLTQGKVNFSYLYNRRQSYNLEQKLRLLLFHRNWEIAVLSPLMITFQRDCSQVLEKGILGL